MDQLLQDLVQVEGVQTVMRPAEFTKLGIPDPGKNPEAPHLVVTTGPGYSYGRNVTGPIIEDMKGQKGSHGHDPCPDNRPSVRAENEHSGPRFDGSDRTLNQPDDQAFRPGAG